MILQSRVTVLGVVYAALLSGSVCVILAQNPAAPAKDPVGSDVSSSSTYSKSMAPASVPAVDPVPASPKPASPSAAPSVPDSKAARDLNVPDPKIKVDPSYIVGVADSLFISVWKEPDLSGPVVVRPDGIITVPVVGDVHVAGLTPPQVQDVLTTKLKDVVAEPQVTVIVRDIKSRKAYLVGKVGRPGAVFLTSPETVLQLLAEAGGPNQFAKSQNMYLLRMVGDHQKRIPFNYKKVLAGSEPDLPVVVGDIIVVP